METPSIKVDAYCGRNVIDRPGRRPGSLSRADPLNKGCHTASMLPEMASSLFRVTTHLKIRSSEPLLFRNSYCQPDVPSLLTRYNQVVCNAIQLLYAGPPRQTLAANWYAWPPPPPCNQSTPIKHVVLPGTIVGFIFSAQEVLHRSQPPHASDFLTSLPAFHVCLLACLPASTSLSQCLGLLQHELHSSFLH